MDVGGPAKTLAEFYAAIFALCLEGSRLSSPDRFHKAIECILPVREAWQQVARDPEVRKQFARPGPAQVPAIISAQSSSEEAVASRWTV